MDKEKATFMLTPRAKEKLEGLKAKLRRSGIARSIATESAIVEAMILHAERDFDRLLAVFQKL